MPKIPQVWRDDLEPALVILDAAMSPPPEAVMDALAHAVIGMKLLAEVPPSAVPRDETVSAIEEDLAVAAVLLCSHSPALAETWGPQAVKTHLTALALCAVGVDRQEAVRRAGRLWLRSLRPGMKASIRRVDGELGVFHGGAPRAERDQVAAYWERQTRLLLGEPTGAGQPRGTKKGADPLFPQRQQQAARRLWDGGQVDLPTQTQLAAEVGMSEPRYVRECSRAGLPRIPEWPPPGPPPDHVPLRTHRAGS